MKFGTYTFNKEMIKWTAGAALALGGAAETKANDTNRVAELERRLSAIHAELDQLKGVSELEPAQPLSLATEEIWSRLQFGLLLEAEAFYGESAGQSESDLTLATAEFAMDAEISEAIHTHVGLLWEEDDTEENNLDEAYIILGANEGNAYHLTVGKMYLPFGNLSSAFISDPLTLELAEINETAALAGYHNEWLELFAGIFNGDADEDSSLENLLASVKVMPFENLEFGAYWISDILETDGLEGFAAALPSYQKEGGAGLFLNARCGEVTVNAEYVTALGGIDTGTGAVKPSAYNIEASLPLTARWTVGAKLEGSDDFYGDLGADKFADRQYGVVAAYNVNEYVTLAGEYLHAEGLDDDESGELATAQLAVAF